MDDVGPHVLVLMDRMMLGLYGYGTINRVRGVKGVTDNRDDVRAS